MDVLLVEDDKAQRASLKRTLLQIDKNTNIYEAEDKHEALQITIKNNIDVFYIDISLKNSSGLDFAMELRKIPRYEFSFIVFLTTHLEYITQAFKQVHCYDYILKPYDIDDVVNMTKRFISHGDKVNSTSKDKSYVVLEIRKGISVKVYVDEILFTEVNLRICMIHTIGGIYKVNNLSLSKILKLINSNSIIRCHKSFAVNIKHIRRIENVDSKLSEIYFENYDKSALLGYKFKNIIMDQFQQVY